MPPGVKWLCENFILFSSLSKLAFASTFTPSLMDHHQDTSINSIRSGSEWSWDENKAFENALAINLGKINPWEKIALAVPGRTIDEIKYYFGVLFADVNAIESDLVPLPDHAISDRKNKKSEDKIVESSNEEGSTRSSGKKGKRKPWSPEEHKLFLEGIEKYGRGDWRSISRHCVLSKTSTQVASHAQKYFNRYVDKEKTGILGVMVAGTTITKGPRSKRKIGATRVGWTSGMFSQWPVSRKMVRDHEITNHQGSRTEEIVETPVASTAEASKSCGSYVSLTNKFGASSYDFYDHNPFMDLKDVEHFFCTSDQI